MLLIIIGSKPLLAEVWKAAALGYYRWKFYYLYGDLVIEFDNLENDAPLSDYGLSNDLLLLLPITKADSNYDNELE